jgi:ferric-dicitrate binding protein FerR (iron transport regulator)
MSRDSDPSLPPALRAHLQDDEDAEEVDELERVWDLLGRARPAPDAPPALDEAWAALRRRRPEIAPDADAAAGPLPPNGQASSDTSSTSAPRARADRRPTRSRRSRRWGRWIGALAVVLMVAVGTAWIWRQPVTLTAAPGQQRTVTLPDGSTVELNSGSTLAYRRGFQAWPFVDANRRRVRLDGEAFFSVHDGSRPFVVATTNARVHVAGTRFNVQARTAVDSTTTVTLAEGRVEVRARRQSSRAAVLDERGETSHVRGAEARPTPPRSTELDPVLAWRQDGFGVLETPLTQVAHKLEQRYNQSIRLHESVTRTNAPLTLYYPTPTPLSTILRDLCTALDLNYRPTSDGYEIFAGPNRS